MFILKQIFEGFERLQAHLSTQKLSFWALFHNVHVSSSLPMGLNYNSLLSDIVPQSRINFVVEKFDTHKNLYIV